MFVRTSVIVTVTPGRTSPDSSVTFPSSEPLTACAPAKAAAAIHTKNTPAIDPTRPIAPSCRPKRSVLQLLALALRRRRQFAETDISERDFVAVILQQDVPLQLRAPAGLVLELALRLS